MGLHGKALVQGGAIGVISVRNCQKVPPCPTEAMPARSKMGQLLVETDPIRDGGSASGITE